RHPATANPATANPATGSPATATRTANRPDLPPVRPATVRTPTATGNPHHHRDRRAPPAATPPRETPMVNRPDRRVRQAVTPHKAIPTVNRPALPPEHRPHQVVAAGTWRPACSPTTGRTARTRSNRVATLSAGGRKPTSGCRIAVSPVGSRRS